MRQGLLPLLLVLSFVMPSAHAEEETVDSSAEARAVLEKRLSENELRREELSDRIGTTVTDTEREQLAHLREENQQLRMQLQRGQAKQPQWLNDQQRWFAVGGGVGVLGFLLGVLTTRGRRRRQWLN